MPRKTPVSSEPSRASRRLPLGKRLRFALSRYEGSNAELGRACGVGRAAVSKWAVGNVDDIGAASAFTIARLCRVNAEWLATGEGSPEARSATRPSLPPAVAADFVRLAPAHQRAVAALVASLAPTAKR